MSQEHDNITAGQTRSICQHGIVQSQNNSEVAVKIRPHSACGHCRAKSFCGSNNASERTVIVKTTQKYPVGSKVIVGMDQRHGWKAVLFAFMFPLLLLIVTLFSLLHISGNEIIAALGAFGILVPYYFCLYLLRNKLEKDIQFYIQNEVTGE